MDAPNNNPKFANKVKIFHISSGNGPWGLYDKAYNIGFIVRKTNVVTYSSRISMFLTLKNPFGNGLLYWMALKVRDFSFYIKNPKYLIMMRSWSPTHIILEL